MWAVDVEPGNVGFRPNHELFAIGNKSPGELWLDPLGRPSRRKWLPDDELKTLADMLERRFEAELVAEMIRSQHNLIEGGRGS